MNNQEVVAALQECKRMLGVLASEVLEPSKKEKNDYQRCEASLPDDLRTLIQEAKEMKWPFVPERWQYKQAVDSEDKTNLQDMINPKLHDLLVLLKASIVVADSGSAAAIVFLIDRFLYWVDASTRLLSVAKALHKMWPSTPIAPQVVIRQARISINSGKLLKAEYILSNLISNNGATGTWHYSEESGRLLVQSVCIQIRGQILQKLGMWYEAAELIWTSIVGYFELPVPDKKGISTSLGILADIFISMSEEDFQRFKKRSHVGLTLLEESEHRLLSAAEACKLAATFSLYTPLFVLTNLNIRGTCLLSYSLSNECPEDKKSYYLTEAKESFEIGLLTKKIGDLVTSKQELHSFVKSVFCLANVHKWLNSNATQNEDVTKLCREAMEKLAEYSVLPDKQDKEDLAKEIMSRINSIKEHLKVKPFPKADVNCYVPDSYRDCVEKKIIIGKVSFNKLLDTYSQHHNAVCEVFDNTCRNHTTMDSRVKLGVCVTALKTTDTVSTVDDTSTQKTGNCIKYSSKSARKKLVRSDAINQSVDEDSSKKSNRSLNVSHSSSLSNSSFSWECIPEHNENDPLICNVNTEKVERICSDAVGIPFQDLSIQEDKPLQPKHHPGNDTGIPTRKHFDSSANQCSDEESFVFIDYYTETESATDVNKSSRAPREQHIVMSDDAKQSLCDQTDLAGETSTEDDEPIGIYKHTIAPPDSSGRPRELNILHEIDKDSETKIFTDDEPINEPAYMPETAGPSDTSTGQSVLHGIDLEAETKYITDDDPIEELAHMSQPPGPQAQTTGQNVLNGIDLEAETKFVTDDDPIEEPVPMPQQQGLSSQTTRQNVINGIDQEAETKYATDEEPIDKDANVPKLPGPLGRNIGHNVLYRIDLEAETFTNDEPNERPVPALGSSLSSKSQDGISYNTSDSSTKPRMLAKQDSVEMQYLNRQLSTDGKGSLEQQDSLNSVNSSGSSGNSKAMVVSFEGEDTSSIAMSNSHGTSSWSKLSKLSGSLSESSSLLNSSVSSFVMIHARNSEQINHARSLDVTDYEKLLSGVSHEWLLKRLSNTGVFNFEHSEKTCNGLLLKFSKKSELWTAQETLVHLGENVDVKNEGKQRKAFWIHFLHQDETLGRYVGKAYKKHKELLYHFSDVERQMTAQYYVTEFNKKLYELNIPTQIFYIPSSVLLIMEDRSIKGCVSVEPYILGDFIKLSNNKYSVRMQYEATKYGLAFGHFTYEFSNHSDIVVDLQGWVTGSEKGEALIYLTDPQIHSIKDTPGAACINFGNDGIFYFFSHQHKECNDICHILSLTRPNMKILESLVKQRNNKSH